jgi:hypothetical protein
MNTISTITLDTWASVVKDLSIQMIKIDVEGHEHAVIEGGRQTIRRHRPYIVVEILGAANFQKIGEVLREENYLDFALAYSALRHCSGVHFHEDAWNHLLVPAEKACRILTLCRQLNLNMQFD